MRRGILVALIAAAVGACAVATETDDTSTTSTTGAVTTSSSEASTTTTVPPPTTTTLPPTTTTTIPTISSGVWVVGSEVEPGVYRVAGYWARLDDAVEIIDNDGVYDNGLGLVNVLESDAYIEVNGEMISIQYLPVLDPIASGFTEGTYLVGVDIAPGRYRVTPVEAGGHAYWARLDDHREINDNDLAEGPLIVIVSESDWALTFTGSIEAFPE
ncbi:MAG TPA: hypothetical protein VJA46_12180 [Acidimicrobiia bacterium]|nr:hypothetical protein [Acidimicrobiia bacterium]